MDATSANDGSHISPEKLDEITRLANPFLYYADQQLLKKGEFGEVAKSLKKRGRIMLIVSGIAGLLFLINGLYQFTFYLDTGNSTSLLLSLAWVWLALAQFIFAFRKNIKLHRIVRALLKKLDAATPG